MSPIKDVRKLIAQFEMWKCLAQLLNPLVQGNALRAVSLQTMQLSYAAQCRERRDKLGECERILKAIHTEGEQVIEKAGL